MYSREEIIEVYNKDALKKGLKKYLEIMEHVQNTDVSQDEDFQRQYNGFYRVRRNKEFRETYYNFMENMKQNSTLTFEDIFLQIKKETNRCEPSFSSKLLATLNPNMPVWDKYVLENLGVKKIPPYSKNREQKIIEVYGKIYSWYKDFLKSNDASLIIEVFDELFPNTNITNTKKIDLFLWQHR